MLSTFLAFYTTVVIYAHHMTVAMVLHDCCYANHMTGAMLITWLLMSLLCRLKQRTYVWLWPKHLKSSLTKWNWNRTYIVQTCANSMYTPHTSYSQDLVTLIMWSIDNPCNLLHTFSVKCISHTAIKRHGCMDMSFSVWGTCTDYSLATYSRLSTNRFCIILL